jgi:ribonuclease VapC
VSESILDASAALALLMREPGAERVEAALAQGVAMSAVNAAEVISKIAERDRHGAPKILRALEELGIEIVPFDAEQALMTGVLRSITKDKGLSLGDRACLALGKIRDLPVLTADAVWKKIEEPANLRVELIR